MRAMRFVSENLNEKVLNERDENFQRVFARYFWRRIVKDAEEFCNIVNSIQFKITKKGFKIIFPISIRL